MSRDASQIIYRGIGRGGFISRQVCGGFSGVRVKAGFGKEKS